MSSALDERQQQLLDFLLNNDDAIKAHISEQKGINSELRLDIYRNAYRIRLRETIDVDHPVLGNYLGDELFDQMVAGYIDKHPSSNKSLRQYADQLPHFLTLHEPFKQHPQISELARFERILLSAFDAADQIPLPASALTSIPAEHWPDLIVRFHPSVQCFQSDWNVVEIWQALKEQRSPPDPKQETVRWLIWRNNDRLTEFRSLNEIEYLLLQGCLKGRSFSLLCEDLLNHIDEESIAPQLVKTISQWLEKGLIIQLR